MLNTILIVAFAIGSGFLIGVLSLHYLWGLIPVIICGFLGAYTSKYGQMLGMTMDRPDLEEKVKKITQVLCCMWIIISAIFFFLGYGLSKHI